ncbi:MAG: glycosyltransferase family 39 protein [Candidatus Zixiibacteriota bacterium]
MLQIVREAVSRNRTVIIVLAIAALLRLLYLWQYSSLPDWEHLTVDNNYHLHWAQSIADGNLAGDTTYFRAPFYVYCLALVIWLCGASLWTMRIFGIGVGIASVLVTYLIGKRLFDRRAGLVAAGLQAFYPMLIYHEGELLLDSLFTLLFQIALFRFLIWLDTVRPRDLLLVGLAIGLGAITRPTIFAILPVIVTAILVSGKQWRRVMWNALLFGVGILAFVGPIFIRNLIVAEDPVLISSQGGINLFIGNNEIADGVSAVLPEPYGFNWRIADITHVAESARGRELKPSEVSAYWTNRAIDWIRSHPTAFVELYLRKLYFFFGPRELSNNRDTEGFSLQIPILRYNPLTFSLVLSVALIGLFGLVRWHRSIRWLVATVVTVAFLSSLFFVNSRFRLPVVPLILCLAGGTLVALTELMWNEPKKGLRWLGGMILAAALLNHQWLELRPGLNIQPAVSEGLFLYNTQNYRGALRINQRALAVDSTFTDLNLNVGACYLRLGQTDSARYYFQREIRFHPDRSKAYVNMASLSLVGGQAAEGSREITRALELRPYDLTANLILVRFSAADSNLSSDSLLRVAELAAHRTRQPTQVFNEAAGEMLSRRSFALAEMLATKALNGSPPPIETDDAAFDQVFINSADNVKREKARSYFMLGSLAGAKRLFAQAIRYNRLALEGDSGLAQAYYNLALAYNAAGDTLRADSVRLVARKRFLNPLKDFPKAPAISE